jgi:putative ABC transport system permease protein
MVLWKFTSREVKNRPGRATLTLLSIVISVAAVVSVTVSTDTTQQAYQEMFATMTGRAALEVVGEGNSPYEAEGVLPILDKTPGVKAVVPVVQGGTNLRYMGGNPIPLLAMGIDPDRDGAVRDYALAKGRFLSRDDLELPEDSTDPIPVLLEKGFAEGLGIGVDEDKGVSLLTSRGKYRTMKVVGLLSPKGAAGFNQGGIVFLPLTAAQEYFAEPGLINVASVVLQDGVSEDDAQAAIKSRLAAAGYAGLTVRTPASRTKHAKDTLKDLEQGLKFAFALSIVLAVFTIFNTFLMNVGERRRQLAILRAIGTTRGQIIRMLLLEGMVMGTVGTVLGSIVGVGGAYLLSKVMGQAYSAAMPAMRVTAGPFIMAGILGPAMSLLGMFIPAYLAGMITPLEGMRPTVGEDSRRISTRAAIAALIIFIVTGSILAACIVGWLPVSYTIPSGVTFTAAFVLLVPIVLGPLSRVVGASLHPALGVEGHLAERQILRRRARTTLTIGVLYIAISTAISLGTTIINNINDLQNWFRVTMNGDLFVRSQGGSMAAGKSPPLPNALGDEIRALDGVANVDTFFRLDAHVLDAKGEEVPVMILVREFTDPSQLPLDLKDGKADDVRQRLLQGEVVIGTQLANKCGVKLGDKIPLKTAKQGLIQAPVAATMTAYLGGGAVIGMSRDRAKELFEIPGVEAFVVIAKPGQLPSVEAELKRICDERHLFLHSFADLRKTLDDLVNGVIASLWGLLALGFVVAAFGIANTLTINVLEQTRELALLRVVAMTRWQVRKTILAQAAIIGMIGLTTGTVGGVIGSYVINLCSLPLLGHVVAFSLHPMLLVVCFALGLAVVMAAAWIPAERAARLNLLIALQYE